MSYEPCIGVIGGDMRQVYMVNYLIELGYPVTHYALCDEYNTLCRPMHSLKELLFECKVIIGPVPFASGCSISSKNISCKDLSLTDFNESLICGHILFGGVIPSVVTTHCKEQQIVYYDFMKISRVAILNTIATAEGTIMEAIKNSTINLHGANALILGFGKCANTLAMKLSGLHVNVTVAARSTDAIASAISYGYHAISLSELKEHLSEFHFIFNTIPACILNAEMLDVVDPCVTIIDIASAPGGIDFDYATQRKLNAHMCLSLPGKVAPKSSAVYLVNEILSLLNERSD